MASSRSALTLGSLTLLGFAAVMVVHFFTPSGSGDRGTTAAPRGIPRAIVFDLPPAVAAQTAAAPAAAPAAAKDAKAPERINPQIARSFGEAGGKIHFEGATEDFQLSKAIAVWQPSQNLVRIVFFESMPKAADMAQLLDAIQSGNLHTVATRAAFVDLHFTSTAQTFDNNAVSSARLTMIDGASMSTADAFNSLDWQGRLPTPEQQAESGVTPRITLKASRESLDEDDEPGRPSWQFTLNAPVIVRD